MLSRWLYPVLLFVFVTSVPAPADILSFSDTTFDPDNYNFSNPPVTTGSVNYSYGQCTDCGNPSDPETYGFRASITTNGWGGAYVGFLNNTFTYNPQAQGAINYIDTSVDKNLSVNWNGVSGSFTINYYPLLEQGGNFYTVQIQSSSVLGSPNSSTGYSTIGQSGLTFDQWGLYDFATQTTDYYTNPDFSANGAPITLGFAPLIDANNTVTVTADYDNLLFDINYNSATSSPVPESSSLGLLSIFLMGLFLRGLGPAIRWRLKRH